MQFIKLTKNITGKTFLMNPVHILYIEEGRMGENVDEPQAKAPASKKPDSKATENLVTILHISGKKDLFVKETPDEINEQLLKVREIKIVL